VNIATGLQEFLQARTKQSWAPDEDLFASGAVSSLLALELVVHLEKAYGVEVDGEHLSLDNFRTINRIEQLVRELQAVAP